MGHHKTSCTCSCIERQQQRREGAKPQTNTPKNLICTKQKKRITLNHVNIKELNTMAAPIGNQFWKLASKHGRDKLFASPQLLWEAACEYFEWIDNNPLNEVDYVGKDAKKVDKPHTRPYTIQRLCFYLGCNEKYINQLEGQLKGKTDPESLEFSYILTRIRQTIYSQKFEGAATGFYNANIIARDLGLTDKKDVTTGGESIGISVNVQDPALKDKLDKE